jgi:hypothetical protein
MRLLIVAAAVPAMIAMLACESSSSPALPAAGPNALEIEVTSTPPGASVVVDGVASGVTPVKLKLNPGPHRARASMSGYYPPPEMRFQVGADQLTTVNIPLMASH